MQRTQSIRHRVRTVAGVEMFYREAGDPEAPAIVLLSGHPNGVHAYNGLIDRLAGAWHVVAPESGVRI
jgi:pimeloyl-ACP methyl ester carboxylesterase